jgi:hypothetical protein
MSNENVQTTANENVEELKQKLCDELAEYRKAEWESLKLEKYKTGKLWEIGDVARPLKDSLGHGNWEPFVQQLVKEGRVTSDRTMQRAMKIRKNFERREEPVGRYSGVGSEMIGALLAGWDSVYGIEINERYVRQASGRLKYWLHRQGDSGFPVLVRP